MYEIDVTSFTIERENIIQSFTLEDYNNEYELYMTDFIDFLHLEVIIELSFIVYHNRRVNQYSITFDKYSTKRV